MAIEIPFCVHSGGVALAGRILRNDTPLTERQPAVIVTGAWLTVKEQMPRLYGQRLVELGYTAVIFDFAGFGQSRGVPAQAEIPRRKIDDIEAVTAFVRTLSCVDPMRIGHLAVCGSAQYGLQALTRASHVRSFASVAGWFHDASTIGVFYGGQPGVDLRLGRGRAAMERFLETGEVTMVPAYEDGNDRAGMFFELGYYADAKRGAIPQWRNEMAELTWTYWFTFDGLAVADRIETPCLFVHGDECVLPENAKSVHDRVRGPKELVWAGGFQVDWYDRPDLVDKAMQAVEGWFRETL
jgi:fermentation-respiration switch protein FrsA (DUF1100 family)